MAYERPLFGKSMGSHAPTSGNEEEQHQSAPLLSEEKARAILEAKAAKEQEPVAPMQAPPTAEEQPKQSTGFFGKATVVVKETAADAAPPPKKEPAKKTAPPRAIHFGTPAPQAASAPETEPPAASKKSETKKVKKPREKKVKTPHRFWRRIWNLLFSDASFRREDCLVPRSGAGIDRIFLISFLILLGVGSVMVFSASYAYAEARYHDSAYFVRRQIIFSALGIGIMLVASMLTVKFYKMITRLAYGITLVLLLAVLVVGVNLNGAQRWIGVGPITIQPTEIAKLTMVMLLAWYYDKYDKRLGEKRSFLSHLTWNTLLPGAIILGICGMVLLQKHLSGIIILGCIGFIVMFAAGSDARHLGALIGAGVTAVACIAIFTDYTKRRIDIWLDPYAVSQEGGWQTIQGLNAIGSGGFLGLGIGDSRMKYSYVSEPANDFIFTITCEELGFVGAIVILAMFAVFIWRGYVIAMNTPDTFAKLLALGIVTKVAVQTILNIFVITNLLPNTGIPLPFFSYGGTSLVIQLMEMGIVLSISRTAQLKYR